MVPYPLTSFEIQKHYENEPRFNGVFSTDNLPEKIKDGAYVINLLESNSQILGSNEFVKNLIGFSCQ